MKKHWMPVAVFASLIVLLLSAEIPGAKEEGSARKKPYLLVLGIAQDGGIPHAGCFKSCCRDRWDQSELKRHATALAVVDPDENQWWLFEATPDFPEQLAMIRQELSGELPVLPAGIFLTHAHIGHYPGLMYLGREAIGSQEAPVYVFPRMAKFLENNGPWSQLVELKNIVLKPLQEKISVQAAPRISVTPFLVPHRDEYSETAGFLIRGPEKKVVFIPDIDKWEKWETDIREIAKQNDLLFLDGTFYESDEISGRDMSEVPHPFIKESLTFFSELRAADRNKIHFIHLNHTNPAVEESSREWRIINASAFNVAVEGSRFDL